MRRPSGRACTDRLQCGQGVRAALVQAGDRPTTGPGRCRSSRGSTGSRAPGGRWPGSGPDACAGPSRSRDRGGCSTARTGRTRSTAQATARAPARSGPAWRPRPGRWTPSRSGSAGKDTSWACRICRTRSRPTTDDADRVVGQVVDQLAQAPVRERPADRPRPRRRDLDDERPRPRAVIRRGHPSPHCGSNAAMPEALNAWITSRTVSGSASSNRAIIGGFTPCADARTITARRTRIVSCRLALRTIAQQRRVFVCAQRAHTHRPGHRLSPRPTSAPGPDDPPPHHQHCTRSSPNAHTSYGVSRESPVGHPGQSTGWLVSFVGAWLVVVWLVWAENCMVVILGPGRVCVAGVGGSAG